MSHMQRKIRYRKIRDYSTITGKFRGASHNKCSKYLDIPKKLPVIFHNLQMDMMDI